MNEHLKTPQHNGYVSYFVSDIGMHMKDMMENNTTYSKSYKTV